MYISSGRADSIDFPDTLCLCLSIRPNHPLLPADHTNYILCQCTAVGGKFFLVGQQ